MLKGIDDDEESDNQRQALVSDNSDNPKRTPMRSFFMIMAIFCAVVALNFVLFLCNVYNSEFLFLYDTCLFGFVPFAISIELTLLAHRIQQVLTTISAINDNKRTLQVR